MPLEIAGVAGQGFQASSGNLVTATNPNLLVCGISVFNPANSGKNILIYSIRVAATNPTVGSNVLQATTVDPKGGTGFTSTPTPSNMTEGGGASVASVSCSPSAIAASVAAPGTLLEAYALAATETELLTSGAYIILPAGSANGIAVMLLVTTAANSFLATARWIEYN